MYQTNQVPLIDLIIQYIVGHSPIAAPVPYMYSYNTVLIVSIFLTLLIYPPHTQPISLNIDTFNVTNIENNFKLSKVRLR